MSKTADGWIPGTYPLTVMIRLDSRETPLASQVTAIGVYPSKFSSSPSAVSFMVIFKCGPLPNPIKIYVNS